MDFNDILLQAVPCFNYVLFINLATLGKTYKYKM